VVAVPGRRSPAGPDLRRALPSSAVQLRCWSRPATTTRLPWSGLTEPTMTIAPDTRPRILDNPGGFVLQVQRATDQALCLHRRSRSR
jgi:hypothetical protein